MMTDKVVTGTLYEQLRKRTSTENQEVNAVEVAMKFGSDIKKAIFNYVCPETGALVAATGFNAHGSVNQENGEVEATLTVECRSCKKEHPITVISFPEMLADKN